jgi:hypothetical protein
MSKWKKSGFRIRELSDLFKSVDDFGGIWRDDVGKFANRSWVMSQQLNYLIGRINRGAFYFPEEVKEQTSENKRTLTHNRKRNIHCVIRVFPDTIFFEAWGTKKQCIDYTKHAAKPHLEVCNVVPVVVWDKHGKMKELKKFIEEEKK